MGDAGAQAVANALKYNPLLEELFLQFHKIGDDGARAIAETLKVNTTLTMLHLGENLIGDAGARAIAEALKVNKSLIILHLPENQIGDAGVRALAEALKVNTTLKRLALQNNQIGDAGAQALAEALTVNTTLTELCMYLNQIGDAGAQAIADSWPTPESRGFRQWSSIEMTHMLHVNIFGHLKRVGLEKTLTETMPPQASRLEELQQFSPPGFQSSDPTTSMHTLEKLLYTQWLMCYRRRFEPTIDRKEVTQPLERFLSALHDAVRNENGKIAFAKAQQHQQEGATTSSNHRSIRDTVPLTKGSSSSSSDDNNSCCTNDNSNSTNNNSNSNFSALDTEENESNEQGASYVWQWNPYPGSTELAKWFQEVASQQSGTIEPLLRLLSGIFLTGPDVCKNIVNMKEVAIILVCKVMQSTSLSALACRTLGYWVHNNSSLNEFLLQFEGWPQQQPGCSLLQLFDSKVKVLDLNAAGLLLQNWGFNHSSPSTPNHQQRVIDEIVRSQLFAALIDALETETNVYTSNPGVQVVFRACCVIDTLQVWEVVGPEEALRYLRACARVCALVAFPPLGNRAVVTMRRILEAFPKLATDPNLRRPPVQAGLQEQFLCTEFGSSERKACRDLMKRLRISVPIDVPNPKDFIMHDAC
ncbi:hypothetical protein CAOG_01938 [Capsaspora owczarzaki ATCC 30864]|uniref:NOD3 protein n=1 Tax=Capsaspora owczarzaki (strain ATCC 30864) TaxID=595528 RepID=A0A0D2VKT7_CAPO3|nr:hypothetical protein CAOG_01938 [Capsaspora owczarzaki ATCC 30864]KJE90667.1 hypothetical protein CAOG_001938 [Capsaspora owczarzaki ATCC 30864]|eukprot:XP_004364806.1 hypothetical protein CAOG_01938 [Capsaspora owczarzaki ATCC 30864]